VELYLYTLYVFLVWTGTALLSKPFVLPNNINGLMFLMEMRCVFCEVNLNFYKIIIYTDFTLHCVKMQSLHEKAGCFILY